MLPVPPLHIGCPPRHGTLFAQELRAYLKSEGIADVVSLKDKSCLNGREYISTASRILFRIPRSVVTPEPGSGAIESEWAQSPDDKLPVCVDTHEIVTKKISGGTVAVVHLPEPKPKEFPAEYTAAMMEAGESDSFWVAGKWLKLRLENPGEDCALGRSFFPRSLFFFFASSPVPLQMV